MMPNKTLEPANAAAAIAAQGHGRWTDHTPFHGDATAIW
jgi:hypothetical protein